MVVEDLQEQTKEQTFGISFVQNIYMRECG